MKVTELSVPGAFPERTKSLHRNKSRPLLDAEARRQVARRPAVRGAEAIAGEAYGGGDRQALSRQTARGRDPGMGDRPPGSEHHEATLM